MWICLTEGGFGDIDVDGVDNIKLVILVVKRLKLQMVIRLKVSTVKRMKLSKAMRLNGINGHEAKWLGHEFKVIDEVIN